MDAQAASAPPPPQPADRPRQPSIYRSIQGEAEIRALYDKVLASLPFEHEKRTVQTASYGSVHVLVCGPADGVPAVLWHGMGAPAPFILEQYVPLAQSGKLRLYVPDLPYQAGSRSDDVLLNPHTHGHGKWSLEVLQALGLVAASSGSGSSGGAPAQLQPPLHIGASFGGAVVIDLANVAPEAIRGAALIVPGGLMPASLGRFLLRMVLPSLLFLAFPRDATLRLALSGMVEETDPLSRWALIPLTWRHVSGRPELPGGHRGFPREQLAALSAPTFVVTAEWDVFWPGKAAAAAAEAALPDVQTYLVLEGRHLPTRAKQEEVNRRVLAFFEERGLLR